MKSKNAYILLFLMLFSLFSPSVYGNYWGNQFRAVAATGDYIDDPNEGYAFRFTAQESKDVDAVALYISEQGSDYEFTVGIEGDNGGIPDGSYINNCEMTLIDIPPTKWQWHTLGNTASLTNQSIYYVTIRTVKANATHRFYFRGTNRKTTPSGRDTFLVTHEIFDANLAPLYTGDGSAWSVRDRSPVFLIHYTDDSYLGVPYDQDEINTAYARVYGGTHEQYQTIIPSQDRCINTLGIYTRKMGSADWLNLSIEDTSGRVFRWTMIDPDDANILYNWEQGVITRLALNASTEYRFFAKSPDSGGGADYWEIRHPFIDTSAVTNITDQSWGGSTSRGELSIRHDLTFRFNQTAFNVGPTADADGNYGSRSGETITFDGSGSSDSDGSITSYSWDWGDGESAGSGVNPTHSYFLSGTYTVALTVTDNEGMTGQATATSVISASVRETFQEVRDVWGTMFQLIVVVMAFALMIGLLKEETSVDEGEIGVGEGEIRGSFLRAVLVLVAGTAVLFILLQVVERL